MSDPNPSSDPGNTDPNPDTGDNPDPNTDPTKSPDPKPDDPGDEALGDAGKKAIKAERDARKAAEKDVADLKDEISRLRRSNAATKGTDLEAIKAEIRSEYATQIAETAIKAEAKGRLADPSDALLYIKPSDVAEGDDAIKAAIDKLLADKPYLAAGLKPWGDVGGGQRNTPDDPEPSSPQARMARAYGKSTH